MNHVRKCMIGILVITAVLISGCNKYKMYTMALDSRRSGAGLCVKKAAISIGEIAYLDNASADIQRKDGDVILMIHGFGGNKDNWVLLADKMPKKYRMIALDLPGHGDSVSGESRSYTIENQAKWVNEFMDTLGIKHAHVMGNSMGGAICIMLTRLYPDKVLSMALLDSAGLSKNESEYVQLLKKGINPLVVGNPDEYTKLLDFVMVKKPYIPGPVLSVMTEQKIARKAMDEKVFKDIMTDIRQVEDVLPEIHARTLILWGDKDRIIHIDCAEEFHQKIKGSQKTIMANTGHMPMIEDPKKTSGYYTQFLSSIQ